MSINFCLQLDSFQEHQLPDRLHNASDLYKSNDDLVISRALDGSTVSTYKDDVWILKMYDAKGRCVYNFKSWVNNPEHPLTATIINELKIIQLARLQLHDKIRKPGSISLIELNKISTLAMNNGLTLHELFQEHNIKLYLIPSYSGLSCAPMRAMLNLLKELYHLGRKHPDFIFLPQSYTPIEQMQKIYDKYPKQQRNDPQQTKLIPSRLYAALIVNFSTELDDFNQHASHLKAFYKAKNIDPLFGLPAKRANKNKVSTSWKKAIDTFNLSSLFSNKKIFNWKELNSYLGDVQCIAKYWIHIFSGMRSNEARHLPSDSLKIIEKTNFTLNILEGYTSKIGAQNHSKTFWITSKIVEKGVDAAKTIGNISAQNLNFDNAHESSYPLFPGLKTALYDNKAFEGAPVVSEHCHSRALVRVLARLSELAIQETDIRELEMFDGFSDWRKDPALEIGKPWPLTTHQCRRSLAVYCSRSKIVSVGSLALQLKQFTETMTSYYRRGSPFAENFINTEDSQQLLREFEFEQRKAQFINYENLIINSTGRLWGGEGTRIQTATDKGRPLIITTDRKITERKFIKGEMALKASPIGFCTNTEFCEKISFTNVLTVCINCSHSILDQQSILKLRRGIDSLRHGQSQFNPKSPEYKQLQSEINHINEFLDKYNLLN
ncbi:hypothetical protein N5F23_04130 [Pseudomonas sichuanensis]|uniref:hypothetical protein n=1 Tax=Pseudomonas sichuanensis TaxID=2213015 RepID=UPI002447E35F|nr:hypothetical protein [Pseudomonas sichuanensis]MDH0729261.1 hypothetical protein [Pseudomonas sichuanensis]MDH1581779.1 hypothetical protein [Pseudomonas sichuanensis]MDH1592068.1 hypothetical protein [Pseudomonas sichuanensis]MDH1597634.1 hypothetical protein [Pseudomonas sichuanensis]